MFFDWLSIHQEFEQEIPIVGSRARMDIDVKTGEVGKVVQPSWQHEGSYSTSIKIYISGNRIHMSGNPSRYGRIENLFGLTSLDECVSVYNRILRSLGLPEFTKCTKVWQVTDKQNGSAKLRTFSDGAEIQEIHVTSNRAAGKCCSDDYLKGLSTLNYRNSIPRLHTNGKTVDWLSKKGNASLIYPSVYDKANELRLHTLDKIKRACGETSDEYRYLLSVIEFCEQNGVVRFEQKIKGRQLTRMNARYWGLFSDQIFKPLHDEFLNIDERLQVTSMSIEGISERLLRLNIVDTTRAANTTALYAIQWMNGQKFDSDKRQIQQHRARLRKIGIDICSACNISRVSPVYIRKAKEVTVTALDDAPSWYRHAKTAHLKLVA